MKPDQILLVALKLVRMVAYGQSTMVLVPFLLAVGCSDAEVGLFMTLTLLGDVLLSTYITFQADEWGRRFMLSTSCLLMIGSGVCFTFCTNFWLLLAAAIFGVISPSGDEVGPFRAIEESTIAQITPYAERAHIYALQNLVGTLGLAVGSLLGGYLTDLFTEKTGKALDAYRVIFGVYTVLGVLTLFISVGLSGETESDLAPRDAEAAQSSQSSQSTVTNGTSTEPTDSETADSEPAETTGAAGVAPLAALAQPTEPTAPTVPSASVPTVNAANAAELHAPVSGASLAATLCIFFGIDSLAYGFMSNSWLVEYMLRTFHSSSSLVGMFFFVSTFISAMTSFPSAWVTNALGPVAAISLTKFGAGLFGALVPAARQQAGAMVCVWLRSLFDTMDVVPRQVFLTSIVAQGERTRVLGLVNVSKTLARAVGPIFTGILAAHGHLGVCFVIMGALEWLFAGSVYAMFRHAMDAEGPIHI